MCESIKQSKLQLNILIVFFYLVSLNQFFSTRDHSAWNIWNGDPMQDVCIPHMIPRAWEQQE